ncbi:MAG TPA: AarF/ABC1/UbiB kinase family protein [Dehalococcoidia bacterium]|nr:AarF/ABC1/UbiB kinase family protein [Dehalococcoidia bacterium]
MSKRAAHRPSPSTSELRLTFARAQRTIVLFWNAAIIAAGYLRVQRKAKRLSAEETASLWEAQHRRAAPRLLKTIRRLRGMFTKSGQYLSARPDLVPEAYIESLATLQDAVPAHPFRPIAAQVERELGAPVGELFASFERKPIASASLAQVHRATLPDGTQVAVKVLYPDIEPLVRADLRNLGLLVNVVGRIWPRYDFRVIYREIARLVPRELDLLSEAASAERIAVELAHRDDVVVPAIVRTRSSARVLTMEFIDGIKVTNVAALREAGVRPSPLAETIVDIFGDQVLGHGFFHGDPHPGNILILRDGRVALIDFGIALQLPEAARLGFATLAHSAASQDPAGMIRAIGMIGVHLPESDMATYLRMAQQTLGMLSDAADDEDDEGAAVNVRMSRGFRGISIDGISGEALFVFRVQGLLRGLRAALGNPGNVFITWDGYARRVLAEADEAQREIA